MSRPAPSLSINTKPASSRSRSSPVKPSPGLRLYDLPSALESPGLHSGNGPRRARPGGLAATPVDPDSRSVHTASDRHTLWTRRSSNEQVQKLTSREPISPTRDDGPTQEALSLFAYHCREFYLASTPPPASATFISSTLASLPHAHRPTYAKLQATLRSLAHLHHLRVRISSFHALISSTYASGSLTPASRSSLAGRTAISERKLKFASFVSTWCGAGGVEPFFRGLWAVLRLQSRGDARRGGGGPVRVVWEIDDAVFLESGGLEFMHEAVIVLKGVLGFTEHPLTSPPKLKRIRTIPKAFSESRRRPPRSDSDMSARSRASSDPFTDVRGRVSPQKPRTSSRGPAPPPPTSRRTDPLHPYPLASPQPGSEDELEVLLQRADDVDPLETVDEDPTEDDIVAEEAELNKPRFRLWSFPSHISDQEAEDLMSLFPRSITAKDVRFPYLPPGHGVAHWEAISVGGQDVQVPPVETEASEGVVRCGTGRMWTGDRTRDSNWPGSKWFKFKRWWKRLFGMG